METMKNNECSAKECHENVDWMFAMGKKADKNGDMALEHKECDTLKDKDEIEACHTVIKHCGDDGKMHVC